MTERGKTEARPPTPRDPVRGFVWALAGTALVSTNFVTAKYALRGFNPETFSTVWTGAAALYALAWLAVTGRGREAVGIWREPGKTGLLGLLTGAGMVLTWSGLQRLDPSFAALLWRFMPVMILLLGVVFLRERIRGIEVVPLVLMVAGGAAGTVGRWDVVGAGVVLTLVAAVAGAGQMLLAKLLVARHSPAAVVFARLGLAAVLIAAWTVALGRADFRVAPSYWAVTLLGALLGPCVSHILQFRSYQHWELSRAGIVLAAQPLFVLPMAVLILGETPQWRELAGGALILAGAFWLGVLSLRPAPAPSRR